VNLEDVDELAKVMARLVHLSNELVDASTAGDHDEIAALMREISALERRRNRLVHQIAAGPVPERYETPIPVRDRVIQTLSLGSRPMAAKLLADVARSFFAAVIPTQSLSSLRRDERRSFASAQDDLSWTAEREVYVVPALTFDRFTPVRGTLALSSWPAEHRLIAPSSPRVDILRITIRLAERLPAAVDPASARRLIGRLGRTIPGATPASSAVSLASPTDDLDTERVIEAARRELSQLTDRDEAERAESADRALAQLGSEALLFGTTVTVARAPGRRVL
jgi:hypothetical protein